MSLFKPNQLPAGVAVQSPSWSQLEPPVPQAAPEPVQPLVAPKTSEDLLNEARMQAAQILQEAAAEAEAAVSEARQQGFELGRQDGFAAGQAELEQQLRQAGEARAAAEEQAVLIRQAAEAEVRARLAEADAKGHAVLSAAREQAAALVVEARAEQKRRLDEAHQSLVDLAVTAAMRLVQGHLALQPGAVAAMVTAGLRRLKDTDCSVRVCPQDLPLLEAQRSILERELGAGLLRLQPDASLTQGSFSIGSPQGMVDGRLEQQAELMRQALNAALGGESS